MKGIILALLGRANSNRTLSRLWSSSGSRRRASITVTIIRGNRHNVDGEHQIAVKIRQLRHHVILNIRGVVFEEQHPAEFAAQLQIVAVFLDPCSYNSSFCSGGVSIRFNCRRIREKYFGKAAFLLDKTVYFGRNLL